MPESKGPESKGDASSGRLDTNLVRHLADVLNETGLTEIEVEQGDLRIRLSKATIAVAAPAPAAAPGPAAAPAAAADAAGVQAQPTYAGEVVKSPMVGTIYLQSQPGSPPFVRVGDTVSEGQTLVLVEAMKTMNPIAAPKAGKISQVLVTDGQPVEYGEPLIVIG